MGEAETWEKGSELWKSPPLAVWPFVWLQVTGTGGKMQPRNFSATIALVFLQGTWSCRHSFHNQPLPIAAGAPLVGTGEPRWPSYATPCPPCPFSVGGHYRCAKNDPVLAELTAPSQGQPHYDTPASL